MVSYSPVVRHRSAGPAHFKTEVKRINGACVFFTEGSVMDICGITPIYVYRMWGGGFL